VGARRCYYLPVSLGLAGVTACVAADVATWFPAGLACLSGGLERHHSLTSPVVSLQLVTLDVADGLRPLSFCVSVGALVVSW